MLLTIFNLYQLCSQFLRTTSRTEETGFFTTTEKEEASHSSVSSAFSFKSKCSDQSTTRCWDATYQLSPLVKVLLLSSSFFSTASSSTAVCSKSAETESWGEQEVSCEEMTVTDCREPGLCGEESPQPQCTHRAQLAQLPQHGQGCSSRLSTLCALQVQTPILTCPASSWQQWAGRLELTHHSHPTMYHIPQLPEQQISVSI